jgi:type II secretory pathway pseudopilin PulG
MIGSDDLRRQRGAVLVVIMVVMALIALLASSLVEHFATSEARAVEDSLMDARIKWAMLGHMTYALARAKAQGLCDGSGQQTVLATNQVAFCGGNDFDSTAAVLATTRTGLSSASMAGSLQAYLDNTDELQNGSVETPGELRWRYPTGTDPRTAVAVGDRSYVDIRGIVRPRDNGDFNAHLIDDGLMAIELEVIASDVQTPVFKGLRDRFRRLTVGFCVTDEKDTPFELFPATGCGAIEGENNIQFLRRDTLLP